MNAGEKGCELSGSVSSNALRPIGGRTTRLLPPGQATAAARPCPLVTVGRSYDAVVLRHRDRARE